MERVVISGGAGFLGSHLCDRMLDDGLAVVVFDNFITGRRKNIEHLFDNPNFTFVEQDVSVACDIEGSVDYIMHLASPASSICSSCLTSYCDSAASPQSPTPWASLSRPSATR